MPPSIRPVGILAVVVAWCAIHAGCTTRDYGDPDGLPIAFSVHIERPFLDAMPMLERGPNVGVGTGVAAGPGGVGVGLGFTFTTLSLYLVGGNTPGSDDVFRQQIHWGDNEFEVPLRANRPLELAVLAQGRREGWIRVATLLAPAVPHSHINLRLIGTGSHMTITDGQGRVVSLPPPPPPPPSPPPPQQPPTAPPPSPPTTR